MGDPHDLRALTLGELTNELLEAEDEVRHHTARELAANNPDDAAYHWTRRSVASVYADFCREELQRRQAHPPT